MDDESAAHAAALEVARRAEREAMVVEQLEARGIRDAHVLAAFRRVPRERFVPEREARAAYADRPLAIGHGQTISQPFVVAFMTAAAEIAPGARVLEVGTGSGYQAAILAAMGARVHSLEIVPELAERAAAALVGAGFDAVQVRVGDGAHGWPDGGLFDVVLVTAAPEHVPPALLGSLTPEGRLIAPVGGREQTLLRVRRTADGLSCEELLPVRFVPMTGAIQRT